MKEYKGYLVSKEGKVISPKGKQVGWNSNGYQAFTCEQKTVYIHRAVWEAFNGKIPADKEIDHINNNRNDNRLENLQLMTREDNVKKSHNSLDVNQVAKIREMAKQGFTYREIGNEVGTSASTAYLVASYKSYRNLP